MLNLVNRKQGRGHFGVNAVNLSRLDRRAATHTPARCAAPPSPQMVEKKPRAQKKLADGWRRHPDTKLKTRNRERNKERDVCFTKCSYYLTHGVIYTPTGDLDASVGWGGV